MEINVHAAKTRLSRRLLHDTHTLFCALGTPTRLPRTISYSITEPGNDVYVSAASTWEIAIKATRGRIQVEPAELADAIEGSGFSELTVRIGHPTRVRSLPLHHRIHSNGFSWPRHSKKE